MEKEFTTRKIALALKELGFNEPCFGKFYFNQLEIGGNWCNNDFKEDPDVFISAPLYQQAINFLYICSNKQIDIELKGSDTYEERIRKIKEGCKDLWNLQNNKSN